MVVSLQSRGHELAICSQSSEKTPAGAYEPSGVSMFQGTPQFVRWPRSVAPMFFSTISTDGAMPETLGTHSPAVTPPLLLLPLPLVPEVVSPPHPTRAVVARQRINVP